MWQRRITVVAVVALLVAACAPPGTVQLAPQTAPKRISFSILEDRGQGRRPGRVAGDFDLFRELGITT